jgi:hypothetical protein
MTAQEHEDEPAGTDPMVDEAEQERRRKAYSAWWRHKRQAAAEKGVYPVDQYGMEIEGEALASWLRGMNQAAEDDAEE